MSRSRVSALLAVGAVISAALAALPAQAAAPASGTLSSTAAQLTWQGATFPVGAGIAANEVLGVEPVCPPASADPNDTVCDHFTLTVDITPGYWAAHPGVVRVSIQWPFPGDHFDFGVYDASGKLVGYSLSGDPMSVDVANATGTYQVAVEPLLVPQSSSYTGTAKILPVSSTTPVAVGAAEYHPVAVGGANPEVEPRTTAMSTRALLTMRAHPVGIRAFEPTIGVDPHGAVYINGRDNAGGPPYDPPVFVDREQVRKSTDGGATWTTVMPTVAGRPQQPVSADPYLWVDPDNGRIFFVNIQQLGLTLLDFSDDGGATWTPGASKQIGVEDHPTVVAGTPPPGVVTLDAAFAKVVYWCTNTIAFSACAHSLDGGRTFIPGPPLFTDQGPNCLGGLTGHLAVDRSGRVFVGAANCGIPEMETSDDGGVTWTESTVSNTIFSDGHDVEMATDAAGTVYAAWTDIVHDLPYLAISHDHGVTWSTPLMVAPPSVRHANYVTVHAGGARGRVALSFLGTNDEGAVADTTPWSYYMTITTDALDRNPLFVSNVVSVPSTGSPIVVRGTRFPGEKDFLDLESDPRPGGRLWGSLAVSCTGACPSDPKSGNDPQHLGADYAVDEVSGPTLTATHGHDDDDTLTPEMAATGGAPSGGEVAGLTTGLPSTAAPGASGSALAAAAAAAFALLLLARRRRQAYGIRRR